MNFKITSAWSALAAMLSLVALYLLLSNSEGAGNLFRSGAYSLNQTFAVLQGRDAKVARTR
jgi:hypothetical protein